MQAFVAILRYDLGQLTRSWLVRTWVALLAIPAVFLIVVAANEGELASETMAAYLAAVYAPLSAVAIAVIAAGAINGESSVVADSVLSRSVTRTEYIAAKIAARLSVTMGIYFVLLVPFAYLIVRYAVSDTSVAGIAIGLLMVASLLIFVASVGMLLSTFMENILFAVLILLVGTLVSGVVLDFLGLSWMSTTAVVAQLPHTFRGETAIWQELRVLVAFSALSAAALFGSVWLFRRKDL